MFRVRQYYGISGTLKGTTIESELKFRNKDKLTTVSIGTDIKFWKSFEDELRLDKNDMNYAAQYLCKLKDFIYDVPFDKSVEMILVERGISDMLFYWSNKNGIDEKLIKNSLHLEDMLIEQNSYYTSEKILLIQKDIDFIKDVVLKEKTRSDCFPGGVEEYLRKQEDYIKFTEKYNNIDKIIKIKDAEKYIKDDLKLEYKFLA